MLLIYSPRITNRLQYIVNTLLKEMLGIEEIKLTDDMEKLKHYSGPMINYDTPYVHGSFNIKPHEILFENEVKDQAITCFDSGMLFDGAPVKGFFPSENLDFPFDIFAASFFLLSRYEEYLPHQKDEYGRYAYTESLAFKESFLHLPLVNIWLREFKKLLSKKFPALAFRITLFKFIPTYDIDVAYAYQHKGGLRTAGGILKSILNFDFQTLNTRIRVLLGKAQDPYDAYEWLDELHLYCRLKPIYFFLVAKEQKGYDKNISLSQKAYRDLIAYHARGYKIGLHPSWHSNEETKILKEEKRQLESITGSDIFRTRQHYLKFDLPQTYRLLMEAGLTQEYSMGYGTINGFRASVASSFYWFDLDSNQTTNLLLYPFCFMDANAHFEQKYSPHQGYAELKQLYNTVRKLDGLFISIWHNNFLGKNPQLKGWREVYEIFLKEDIYWD